MAENHRKRWLLWGSVIVIILIVIGIWHFRRGRADAPQYETEAVKRGDLMQVVTATGTLNAVTNVTVGCQVSGKISKLFADYNSSVTNGQLIAQIDPRIYEAQVEQASADLASAKANLELQQVETTREAQLYTNKLVSGSDYDTAVATLHEAQATVQIKQAALDNAKANLGFCDIYAPIDGVVISRSVDVGQTVTASFNTPALFQIANNLRQMQIDAAVDEADIGGVKEGQPVDFTVDAYPNRTFHGTVTQVRNSPTNSNNVITYDTVIGVDNADLKLKPGMTATVSIIVADLKNVLEIPNAALRFQPVEVASGPEQGRAPMARPGNGGNRPFGQRPGGFGHGPASKEHGEQAVTHTVYAMTKGPDGGTELKPIQITTGITDNINTQVFSGLQEGEQIVTGLAIPGLDSAEGPQNPFAFRRRF